jgi:hypothetical protein
MFTGPNIVKNGLVLWLDAANTKSYPRSGTNWADLSGNGNICTLVNGPVFSTDGGGSITFDKVDDYGRLVRSDLNGGSFAYTNITCNIWIKPGSTNTTDPTANNIITVENAFEISIGSNSNGFSSLQYASVPWAWYGTTANVLTNERWNMITFVHATTGRWLYVNGVQVFYRGDTGGISAGISTYPYLTLMARYSGNASLAKGSLGTVFLYNRTLSAQEIAQNYNATKARYGL